MIKTFAQHAARVISGSVGIRLPAAPLHRGYTGPRPPAMQSCHVAGCEVLPDRAELLRRLPQGGVAAEIGVDQGDFAESILQLNSPSRLHLVDAWQGSRFSSGYDHVRTRFRDEVDAGMVVVHRGLSTDVLPHFPDSHFDWVYIDTDHSYDTTLAELTLCASKVKPSGYIAGHDFADCSRTGIRYGVIPACHEFCTQHGWRLAFLTVEYASFHSFCLARI